MSNTCYKSPPHLFDVPPDNDLHPKCLNNLFFTTIVTIEDEPTLPKDYFLKLKNIKLSKNNSNPNP